MIILSGPEKGSYEEFADDIVALLGEKSDIKLQNNTTDGSAFNFKMLADPNTSYKMALIQSDYLNLMDVEDKINDTDFTGSLKVVMKLAREQIHFVTEKSSGLASMQDLDNKRVGIGTIDQGGYATAKIIREKAEIDWTTVYVGFDELLSRLFSESIHAGFVMGSAPLDMFNIDPQVMVDEIALLAMENLNGWAEHYEKDTIYSEDYLWLEKDVPTFGVRTLLVVNEAKLTGDDQQNISIIKSTILQNLDYLKESGHPRWSSVSVPE